jgi:hypothetical protein
MNFEEELEKISKRTSKNIDASIRNLKIVIICYILIVMIMIYKLIIILMK